MVFVGKRWSGYSRKWTKLVFLFLTLLCYIQSLNGDVVQDNDDDDNNSSTKRRMINFASYQAGAVVIDKSPANGKGFNNLLNDDRDKYAICSAHERKWVVIGLSEEVAITSVAIANYEKYSSTVREFQLLGSLKYPTNEWNDLGTYTAQLLLGEQNFNIINHKGSHTRYLKIRIISHYLDEELFTLSQIKVYGQTVFVSLQEEVARSDETSIKLLLQDVRDDLLREDLVLSNESGDATVTSSISSEDSVASISIAGEEAASISKVVDDSDPKQQGNGIDGQIGHIVDDRESSMEQEQTLGSQQQQQQDFVVSSESIFETDGSVVPEVVSNLSSNASENQNNKVNMEGLWHVQSGENGPILAQSSSEDQHFDNSINVENSEILNEEETQSDEDKEEDENVTVEHETSGQVERLSFNRTEWNIVSGALQRSNLTVDFLKTTIQSIKQFFVDPLSQKMDMHNLERFISTQMLPATPQSSLTSETEESSTTTDSSSGVTKDEELKADNRENTELLVKDTIDSVDSKSHFDNDFIPSSNMDSIGKDGNENRSSNSQGTVENQEHEDKFPSTDIITKLEYESLENPPLVLPNATSVFVDFCNETISSSESEETAVNEINNLTTAKEEVSVIDENEIASDIGASSSPLLSTDGIIAATDLPLHNSESTVVPANVDEQTTVSTASSSGSEQVIPDSIRSTGNATLSNITLSSPSTYGSHSSASTPLSSVSKSHPSSWSSCLDQLKFSDFQARMMAKLQNKNASSDSMTGGNNNASTAQNDLAHSSNNNNIFKQIIQRMKNLEANQAISDIYLSQLSDCLRIIRDEMFERQQQQDEFNILSQQNPLSALFTMPLVSIQNQSRSSNIGSAGSSPSNIAIHTIPLLTSFAKGNTPLDAFWTQMFQFLRALIRIMWRFVWIVVLSGRQEQGLLLTNTLQELRTLLQTSVVEFWCALVCGLVVSLLFGLMVLLSIFVWMLLWCCCGGGNRIHHKEKEFSLNKRR